MGYKFDELRQELNSLGYPQILLPECVPLVEKLLADLKITTKNLQKYMKISQHALEERDTLELGAEPYKCDNAKLIRECNDLHLAFIYFKEKHEKIQRDLRNQVSDLKIQLENCRLEKVQIMSQLQQSEKERFRKASRSGLSKDQAGNKENKKIEPTPAAVSADENSAKFNKELKDLKDKHAKLVEDNVVLQNQLVTREEEINRLQMLIECGRPYKAVSKDCCYQNVDGQIALLQDEVTRLKREKNDFLTQVKDALAKQHEAMRRALHLAERNRQLEKEMRDIDEIALAVEAECNNTVKGNSEKVTRLQDRINESLVLIQNLERDNAKLKQLKLELSADLDAVKLEKLHLEKQLDQEMQDKKRLNDRINNFTIIEDDLNLEIDRLTKLTAEQKRQIAELESQVSSDKTKTHRRDAYRRGDKEDIEMSTKLSQNVQRKSGSRQKPEHKKSGKKTAKTKSPTKSGSPTKMLSTDSGDVDTAQKCCCETGNCMKNLKELLDKEMEYRQAQASQSIENLKQEKEYYMKEYHKALEQMRNLPTKEKSDAATAIESLQEIMECKQQLKEKEVLIMGLENEIKQLKSALSGGQDFNVQNVCTNPNCKRREREMDIKTSDLKYIEMENNTLKTKLQALNETTLFNDDRMKKAFQDMEEHIRKLEDEKRQLVKTDLTQRSNVSQLEEEYTIVKEQLRQTQTELKTQKTSYNQLKLLHEQTDRALSEAQAQIVRAETELANYQSKMRDSSRDTATQDREISKLTSDVQIMKSQLTKLDREKDDLLNNLDEKTERIALLEDELAAKNKNIGRLEGELKELKRKLSKYADETSRQDHVVHSKIQEVAILEQDYEKERRLKEAALLENKRLQSDLTSVTCDCREARNELEISRRQVEDLKRPLQHYVAEVKRTEDLISNKELERTELLDQFRCLSQEANILENNNHTLENEATQSRVQLSVALDHTSELERRLENQESIIRSYEKQISELTAQVASLEVQLKQNNREQEQYGTEMKQMRDLCLKLEKDKDSLKHELYSKEDWRAQVGKATDKLASEKEALQQALEKERTNLESVEKLLNEARQDIIEQRLLNQDLQNEIGRLKQKIAELQDKFPSTDKSEPNAKVPELSPESPSKRSAKDTVQDGRTNLEELQQSASPSRVCSAMSTKTLTTSSKYHGSDGFFHGVIDLTKLDQDNMDCYEQCERHRCPLHQKMFMNVNWQDEVLKNSKTLIDQNHEDPTRIAKSAVKFPANGNQNMHSPNEAIQSAEAKPPDHPVDDHDKKFLRSTMSLDRKDCHHESESVLQGVTDLDGLWNNKQPYNPKSQSNSKNVTPLDGNNRSSKPVDDNKPKHSSSHANSPVNNKTLNRKEKGSCETILCSGLQTKTIQSNNIKNNHNLCFVNKCVDHKNQPQYLTEDYVLLDGQETPTPSVCGRVASTSSIHSCASGSKCTQNVQDQNKKSQAVTCAVTCRCQCVRNWSNASSVSDTNIAGKCWQRGLAGTSTNHRKLPPSNAADKNRLLDDPKATSDRTNKEEANFTKNSRNDSKLKHHAFPDGRHETNNTGIRELKNNRPTKKNANSIQEEDKKLSKSPSSQPKTEAQAEFTQDSDDSAVFRKVFSIDGVGLQCHCCISSFKT